MKIPKLLTLATALLALALPSRSHAQTTTTYTIGSSLCGVGSLTWIDCYNMPLTDPNGKQSTAWIEMDYSAHAEDFLDGAAIGDNITSNVEVAASIAYQGHSYPTEVTANLQGVNQGTGQLTGATGTLNLKISYKLCKVSAWTTGLCSNTAGGTVTVTQ
jgi:hypothetical protein